VNKKRVLVIGLTERMGGVETFIYNSTIFSDKTKYKYDFLVHGTDHCVFEKEINDFYNDGEKHIFFVRKYKENPFGCICDLYNFYKDNAYKYNLIHFQSGSTAEILYVYPFCKKYKIPVISHSHNGNGYSPVINAIFRYIVNKISYKRVACSEIAAAWLFGSKHVKSIEIIVNGIDTERFKFDPDKRENIRKKYNIQNNQLVIGHIGRFSQQKNHAFILKVFFEILQREASAILMLVGVGEKFSEVKDKCLELGINNFVVFTGKQLKTEDYYSAFDVFLMPSLYEGLPIVGVEAQCEGLSCFFSDQIDKQIILSNKSYVLPLTKHESEWAEFILMNHQIEDRKDATKMIENKGYSIQSTIRELEKIYGFN